jgi:epoxyqueuosine reductase QueG
MAPSSEPSGDLVTGDELCARARALGFDLVGVAPAAEFATVPAWARSIVVLGMAALDPALDLELYVEAAGEQRWSKWAYERLVAGAARLALALVEAGHRAQPLTYEDSLALLDLKAAAVRAGLGVWGLNHLVITHHFGPRVRLGAVFTDLDLPAGAPLHDYYCVSCSLCLAACPTGALGPAGLDRSRCIGEFEPDAAMARLQKEMVDFPTPYTRRQCAACVDACPIGKRLPARFWGLDPCP